MSAFSIQEAQDLANFATQTGERLTLASARFDSEHDARTEERAWLAAGAQRVSAALERVQAALLEAAPLPEFANARKVKSETLANAWADAIEGVFDAVVANVSANGPLIEALFPISALRRCAARAAPRKTSGSSSSAAPSRRTCVAYAATRSINFYRRFWRPPKPPSAPCVKQPRLARCPRLRPKPCAKR